MTQPRSLIVNPDVTRWYHCISRCVRRAFLLIEDHQFDRKEWIDNRLKELDSVFAVSVAGFSIMDNHLHLLLRIDTEIAQAWNPIEVVQRWLTLYPLRAGRTPKLASQEELSQLASNAEWVEEKRARLSSLSWFMKCLKEPLSRMANREDECRGTFFEGRFKSIAILDEESILSVAAYIDLNPVAAGIAKLPEQSPHTSIQQRVEHLFTENRLQDVQQIRSGNVAAQRVSEGVEDTLWLIPIEDRRDRGAKREGIKSGFTLGQYLLLVDSISRKIRDGKAQVAAEVESILDRISIASERWFARMTKLLTKHRWYGSFMSTTREALNRVAAKLGVKKLASTA